MFGLVLSALLCLSCARRALKAPEPGSVPSDDPPPASVPVDPNPSSTTPPPLGHEPNASGDPPATALARAGDALLYPPGRAHSPITTSVATHLRALAAHDTARDERVFMKVGDSISYSAWFMDCYAPQQQNQVKELGDNAALQGALDQFSSVTIDGETPLNRRSLATKIGATAAWPITGMPAPLTQELGALNPRFAVVMYGTNDLNATGSEDGLRAWFWRSYAQNVFTIADTLIAVGIIPALSAIPYSGQHPTKVPVVNLIVRGIAQALQVPFIDYYLASSALPNHGVGGDGIHPSVYMLAGIPRACFLTPEGLQFGYNVRNLVTLEALERLRQVVTLEAPEIDAQGVVPVGAGTASDPLIVGTLPFAFARAASETVYRFAVAERMAIRALVVRRSGYEPCRQAGFDCNGVKDTTLSLFSDDGALIASNNTVIARSLEPGIYRVTVAAHAAPEQPAIFLLMRCETGDAACE